MTSSLQAFETFHKPVNVTQPLTVYGPSDAALSSYWGAPAEAGFVNEQTCLTLSAFWAGVTLIAESLGQMPLQVFRRRKDKGWDLADQHPANYLLTKSNNGWMVPSTFKSLAQTNNLLGGNCVGEIVRNFRGQAAEIHPWLPQCTNYGIDGGGYPMYGVTGSGAALAGIPVIIDREAFPSWVPIRWFPYTECIHLKGFSTNGYIGLKILDCARMNLGTSMIMETFQRRFFQKGRPAGFITTERLLSDDQIKDIRQEWKELYEKAQNAGRVGILHGGLSWESMGYTNDDAQLLQNKEFSVLDVSRWLRVPPHMLGDLTKATEVNIEQLFLEFVTTCLIPWCVRWEEELNLKLFTPKEQFVYECFFDLDAFFRADRATTAIVETADVRNGTRTVEEVRLSHRRNPYDEATGETADTSASGSASSPSPADPKKKEAPRPGSRPFIMASQLDLMERVEDGTSKLQGGPEPAPGEEPPAAPAKKKEKK